MGKKLITLIIVLVLVGGVLVFGQQNPNPNQNKQDMAQGPQLPLMGPWMKGVDLPGVMKKFNLQREQINLDLRKAMLPVEQKKEEIFKKLNDLTMDISKKADTIALIKELYQLEQQGFETVKEFQVKEKEINDAFLTELRTAIEAYFVKLEKDDKEFLAFLEQFQKKDKPKK
jgi:hypothetical protein